MPSQTFIIRAHARTIHTRPVTFVCKKCGTITTRDCYPGPPPKYCLGCAPKKKQTDQQPQETGMFRPTHNLIVKATGQKTPVCLTPAQTPGWYWVRTALDWFNGESIIEYHERWGLRSRGVPLVNYSLEPLAD